MYAKNATANKTSIAHSLNHEGYSANNPSPFLAVVEASNIQNHTWSYSGFFCTEYPEGVVILKQK